MKIVDFDIAALFKAMDSKRISRKLSWSQVAKEIWELSADLNRVRHDHPISPSTIISMSKMVERGTDLSIALRETAVFPPYVADMVSVGESSGNLEEMLASVSEYYETNANQKIAAFTSMVEPLIIVIMGALVGFIMVSIMLPLFEMNRLLSHG